MPAQIAQWVKRRDKADNLADEIMAYLNERAHFADELGTPIIASIGAHKANLVQWKEGGAPFWFVKGVPEDIRVCLLMVAPSGMSKTYMMKFFIQDGDNWGLLDVKSGWEGKITEPGFVGSWKDGEEILGAAKVYEEGIAAWNEITNIVMASQNDHSAELVNQVMEAVSEGKVTKRLAAGPIIVHTRITIWGGVQPGRFNMTAGLMRRLFPVARVWTPTDLKLIQKGRRDRGKDDRFDPSEIQYFRRKLREVSEQLAPESVDFSEPMYEYMEKVCDGPHQQMMIEKMLFGWAVIEDAGQRNFFIKLTEKNKALVADWVGNIKRTALGSDISLMVSTLNQFDHLPTVQEVFNSFRQFSYNYIQFQQLMEDCLRYRIIFRQDGKLYSRKMKKQASTEQLKVDKARAASRKKKMDESGEDNSDLEMMD